MRKKWMKGIPWRQFRNVKFWLTMKLFCLLWLVFILPVSGKAFSQHQRIDIAVENVSLETLIKEIKEKASVNFLYNLTELDKGGTVTVKMQKATVEEILQTALKGSPLGYVLTNDVVVIRPLQQEKPDPKIKVIKGVVRDENGDPLPGVTIFIKGTKAGVITDNEGNFTIPITTEKPPTLTFSFVGRQTKEVLYKGEELLEVTLLDDIASLDEVVVTGYQRIDPRYLTSAITSVKASDILVPGMTSIDQALEGRIPELRLIANSGEVGATPRIRVRGTSSLLGNREPLWVLDGFIMRDPVNVSNEDLNNPDYINIIGNAIAGINPQDIERIDILKDAAATALYGTRAANGVIVVTTKKGAVGRARFSYNHSSKMTRRPRYSDKSVDLMNSRERVQFGKDLTDLHYKFPAKMPMVGYEGALYRYYTGLTNFDEFEKEVGWYETVNTDWFDVLTQDSYSQDHTFGVSGGTEDVRYYASVGYNRENGVSRTSFTERFTARLNMDVNFNPKLTMNFSLDANVQKKNHLMDGIDAMDYAYNTTRALPCYNEDGSLYYYDVTSTSRVSEMFRYNILNEIRNSSNTYDGNGVSARLSLRYKLIESLTLNLAGNYNRSSTDQEKWWGEKSWHVACLKNGEVEDIPRTGDKGYSYIPYGGILITNHSTGESYTFRTQFDYHKRFGMDEMHQISASGGFEMNGNVSKSISDENRGFVRDRGLQFVDKIDLEDYPLYKEWINQNHRGLSHGISHQISGYLTLSYSFRQDFSVNVNGRFDASNKFGSRSNEKFLPIWSASAMWNLKENVLKEMEAVSEVRLRASFGVQGNMLEDQSPNLIIRNGTVNPTYNENISTIARYPNPNLRWEKTKHLSTALSISLLDSRLNLEGSFYYKKTDDCFTHVQVSSVNGVSGNTYVMNGGVTQNSGYSISISATPVKLKDFQWYISTYFDGNMNKVKTGSVESFKLQDYLNGTALVDGEAISTFYSYKFLGLDPANGTPMFNDYHDRQHLLENKTLEETVLLTMENSGQRDPIFSSNLSNSFRYKGLSFAMNFTYSIGGKVRLFKLYDPIISGVSSASNVRKEFINRWRVPGDELRTDVPVIMSPSNSEYQKYRAHFSSNNQKIKQFAQSVWNMYDLSDKRVVSASYLKCSSVSLRYVLDAKFLRKTPFSSLSLSLNALNLFTVSAKGLKGQEPTQSGFDKPNLSVRPSYTLQFGVTF